MNRLAAILALAGLLFAAPALAAGEAGSRQAEAEAELAKVAARIEELKAAGQGGSELDRLLVRSQELADLLGNLSRPPEGALVPPAPGPDAQELREQADLARDQADRLAATLGEVDRQLAAAKKRKRLEKGMNDLASDRALFDEQGASRLVKSPALFGALELGSGRSAPTSDQPGGTPTKQDTTGGLGGPPPPLAGGGAGHGSDTAPPPSSAAFGSDSSHVASGSALRPGDPRAVSALAAQPGDDDKVLARKKAELLRALDAAKGRADSLDAKAREASQIR
jgi:hypothetical protein